MIRILLAAALILTGCETPISPKAVPATQKLDCDLIFPAPAHNMLTP